MRYLTDFEPLGPAEASVVQNLGDGEFDRVDDGVRPEAADADRRIRASFLRFLIVGGPHAPYVHEKGVRITGAFIDGTLDLEGCRISRDIGLTNCLFSAPPILRSAVVDTLFLDGSKLPGISAERLQARGDVYLRRTEVNGPLLFEGARLGGSFVATAARAGDQETAVGIDLTATKVDGSILLRGANVVGGLSVSNARVGADLEVSNSTLERTSAAAIDGHGVVVGIDLILRRTRLRGMTLLEGARVGGDADLSGANFFAPDADACSLARAHIEGALILRDGIAFRGLFKLNGARLGVIVDDPAGWPKPGDLALNRCTYDGFLATSVDASSRLRWLALQHPTRFNDEFWPQPYEQLAQVLRGMGHGDDARRILFAKEELQRRARRLRTPRGPGRTGLFLSDLVLRHTVGFGLQVHRVFLWLALFWIAGAGLLALGAEQQVLRPNVAVVLRSPEWVLCGSPTTVAVRLASTGQSRQGLARQDETQFACWWRQPEAVSYPPFNPFMFSIDTLLPALDTGQRAYWSPDSRLPFGRILKNLTYAMTIAGWALSLLAVAAFSGLVRNR